jgi:hypothetical protein
MDEKQCLKCSYDAGCDDGPRVRDANTLGHACGPYSHWLGQQDLAKEIDASIEEVWKRIENERKPKDTYLRNLGRLRAYSHIRQILYEKGVM